jgi:tetratricopeptide (TPR) repeat protein
VKQALFELYEHWGNVLFDAGDKDYAAIVEKYERALRFVNDYDAEEAIKDRLVDAIHMYTDTLIVQKDYAKAIRLLKTSLRFRYTPESLIQIAEAYEKMSNLDEAINWYRKAFDANPKVISLRLTNVLVQKGRMLLDEKKPEEAQKFFDEADRISLKAKIPLDSLYPVQVSNVKVDFDIDADTGEFDPKVVVKFSNDSPLPLNFLITKAEFISGDEELAVATEVVATPDKPMGLKKDKTNSRTVTIKPDTKLNVHALSDNKLIVKIYIAYREGEDQVWKQKSLQEIIIKGDEVTSETAKQV